MKRVLKAVAFMLVGAFAMIPIASGAVPFIYRPIRPPINNVQTQPTAQPAPQQETQPVVETKPVASKPAAPVKDCYKISAAAAMVDYQVSQGARVVWQTAFDLYKKGYITREDMNEAVDRANKMNQDSYNLYINHVKSQGCTPGPMHLVTYDHV